MMLETQNLVFNLSEKEQAVFYRKTYAHVAGSVLAFILIEAIFLKINPLVEFMFSMTKGYYWLGIIGLFWLCSFIAGRFTHSLSRGKQYLGLGLYVVVEAIIFVPMLAYASNFSGSEVIQQAAIVTLFLFIGLSAVAFMSKQNFSFLRNIITIGGFVGLGIIVASAFGGFHLGLWFSVFMVVIAAASILYQTNQLKYTYLDNQYVGAALGLFSSLMLLFWYILRIFMSKD